MKKGTVVRSWTEEVFERTRLSSAEEVMGDKKKPRINDIMCAARSHHPNAVDFIGKVLQQASCNGNFHEVKLEERTNKRRKTTGEFRQLIAGDGADLIAFLYRQCGWQLHLTMSSLRVHKLQEGAEA